MASKSGLDKMYPQVQIKPMFTTYYSMCSKLDFNKNLIIEIFRSEKIDFKYLSNGTKCSELYPAEDLLFKYKNNLITEKEYIEIYTNQLVKLDAKSLIYNIYNRCAGGIYNPNGNDWLRKPDPESPAYGKHLVFVCVDDPGKFCHRHILSKWFQFFGFECSELKFKDGEIVEI